MHFAVLSARLHFAAVTDFCLAAGQDTNLFRSALGAALRGVGCSSSCPSAQACPTGRECPYGRLFEPSWPDGPSGYRDVPRPFVLRGAETGAAVRAGQSLFADLFFFDPVQPPWSLLAEAFSVGGENGWGSRGRSMQLRSLEPAVPLLLPLEGSVARDRVCVRFVTPTELKRDGKVIHEPDFSVLIQRLSERVRLLGMRYQGWPASNDFAALLAAAPSVRLASFEWTHHESTRRSARSGVKHSIGGYTGWAEYIGPLGEFLPLLDLGYWTGVGRQTVWGKGALQIEALTR
jgi:hypothetical protein